MWLYLIVVYIIIYKYWIATITFLILLSHAMHLPSLDEKFVDTLQEPFSFSDKISILESMVWSLQSSQKYSAIHRSLD